MIAVFCIVVTAFALALFVGWALSKIDRGGPGWR